MSALDGAGAAAVFLALDTATDVPSLALGTATDPGEDLRVPSRRDLSREIERATAALLARERVDVGGLAGVIVADGPGSFTGLRIGIAFAKGLCRAGGLPLLAAPSMLGAAFAASGGAGSVLVAYDALRGDVYRALYRFAAGGKAAPAVEVVSPPSLVPGDAPAPDAPGLRHAGAAHASAGALLRLRAVAGGLAVVEAPDRWEPAYGRLAEAEVRRRAGQH